MLENEEPVENGINRLFQPGEKRFVNQTRRKPDQWFVNQTRRNEPMVCKSNQKKTEPNVCESNQEKQIGSSSPTDLSIWKKIKSYRRRSVVMARTKAAGYKRLRAKNFGDDQKTKKMVVRNGEISDGR